MLLGRSGLFFTLQNTVRLRKPAVHRTASWPRDAYEHEEIIGDGKKKRSR
jgi:hypothetical protein